MSSFIWNLSLSPPSQNILFVPKGVNLPVNVLLQCSQDEMLCLYPSEWAILWAFRCSALLNVLSQENCLSLVWHNLCFSRLEDLLNDFEYLIHENGHYPVCFLGYAEKANYLSQLLQENCFYVMIWMLMCFFRLLLPAKQLLQNEQVYVKMFSNVSSNHLP